MPWKMDIDLLISFTKYTKLFEANNGVHCFTILDVLGLKLRMTKNSYGVERAISWTEIGSLTEKEFSSTMIFYLENMLAEIRRNIKDECRESTLKPITERNWTYD